MKLLTGAVLLALLTGPAAPAQHQHQQDHPGHEVATAARMEVADDAAAQVVTVRVGPLNLPARRDHHGVEQAPDFFLEIPFDGWITAYAPRLVDRGGHDVPGRLLHHVAFWHTGRSDFLCPNKEEHIFGAGGEMNEWPPVPGVGYRVRPGERIRVDTMFHNPTEQDHPETYLEVTLRYQRAGVGAALRHVYPAWFNVRECGRSAYDLPVGRDERKARFTLRYSGRLLGVGGHMHDYGRSLELRHLGRGQAIATLAPSLDADGRIQSVPIVSLLTDGGYRLEKGDEVEVTAVYDNPTGRPLPEGAMGIVVGYFLPDADEELTALARRQIDTSRSEQVDGLFRPRFGGGGPGAAVAVVRDGAVVHSAGYGYADITRRVPVAPDTVFDLASVSKQITAAAIVLLAERGRLGYDDPLLKFFPEFPDYARHITIRHLVNHTSGLPDYEELFAESGTITRGYPRAQRSRRDRFEPTVEDVAALLAVQKELRFAPGDRFEYSNSAYVLLALIVEKASGMSFPQFLERDIFGPLGMRSTLVADETRPEIPNRAAGYQRRGGRHEPADYTPLNLLYGDGNIYSTAEDLSRWYQGLMAARQLWGDRFAGRFAPGRLNNGDPIAYAFGWNLGERNGMKYLAHTGSWAGFRNAVLYVPEERLAIVILTNSAEVSHAERSALLWRLARIYLGNSLEAPSHVPIAPEKLRDLAGKYRIGESTATVTVRSGELWMNYGGLDRRLLPAGDNEFIPEGAEGDRVMFEPEGRLRIKLFVQGDASYPNAVGSRMR